MSEATRSQDTLFGHPKGLFVLFFTELWERFSFYSMRGILTLYMVSVVLVAMRSEAGGQADAIYGAYLGFVYATTFIGGTLADRLLGQRRAIYIGGSLMALAQFTLAAHALLIRSGAEVASLNWLFFTGLGLLSAGNGFFKPNISTVVGTLYEQGDGRRDAAFTIFYMGINTGAVVASFSAGFAQQFGWHLGFLLAGTGMLLSLLIFFSGAGRSRERAASRGRKSAQRRPSGPAPRRCAGAGNCGVCAVRRLPDFTSRVGAESGPDHRRPDRAVSGVGSDAREPGRGGADDGHPRVVRLLDDVLGLLRIGGQYDHSVHGRCREPQHVREGSAGRLPRQFPGPTADRHTKHSGRCRVGLVGAEAAGSRRHL